MKNVTLSAQESLIRKARQKAGKERTTLNSLFRKWLARYVGQEESAASFDELMGRLSHVKAGKRFTREEMNER